MNNKNKESNINHIWEKIKEILKKVDELFTWTTNKDNHDKEVDDKISQLETSNQKLQDENKGLEKRVSQLEESNQKLQDENEELQKWLSKQETVIRPFLTDKTKTSVDNIKDSPSDNDESVRKQFSKFYKYLKDTFDKTWDKLYKKNDNFINYHFEYEESQFISIISEKILIDGFKNLQNGKTLDDTKIFESIIQSLPDLSTFLGSQDKQDLNSDIEEIVKEGINFLEQFNQLQPVPKLYWIPRNTIPNRQLENTSEKKEVEYVNECTKNINQFTFTVYPGYLQIDPRTKNERFIHPIVIYTTPIDAVNIKTRLITYNMTNDQVSHNTNTIISNQTTSNNQNLDSIKNHIIQKLEQLDNDYKKTELEQKGIQSKPENDIINKIEMLITNIKNYGNQIKEKGDIENKQQAIEKLDAMNIINLINQLNSDNSNQYSKLKSYLDQLDYLRLKILEYLRKN